MARTAIASDEKRITRLTVASAVERLCLPWEYWKCIPCIAVIVSSNRMLRSAIAKRCCPASVLTCSLSRENTVETLELSSTNVLRSCAYSIANEQNSIVNLLLPISELAAKYLSSHHFDIVDSCHTIVVEQTPSTASSVDAVSVLTLFENPRSICVNRRVMTSTLNRGRPHPR